MAVLRLIWALIAAALLATPALAQAPERTAPAAWVQLPEPAPAVAPAANGFPIQILDLDQQVRFDDAGTHAYIRSRTLIRTVQGLASMGTVVAAWKPGSQILSVHALNIVRGDQVIDVLATQSFEVLRREQRLEASILDGVLTATLQPGDLRVGDILEFAFTISSLDPVVGARAEYLTGGQFGAPVERFRLRASWPTDRNIRIRARAPWTLPVPRRTAHGFEVEITETALQPLEIPTNVPVRFQQVRQLELSDHGSWNDISSLLAPLYDTATQLEPDSPLQAEIDRIARTWSTPKERASAALRLVQDDVRYLLLAMGQGGLVPASADETWRRRFGDCKGKTALLIALLRGLGIEAEPAAVSTLRGDGLNERLPMIGLFDHVLVRATIDGQVHWLDGARTGDRSIETMPVARHRWALPLRNEGAALEAIVVPPADRPTLTMALTYDASAGLDAETGVTGEMVLTGDVAGGMRSAMDNITDEQREEGFRSMWAIAGEGFEIDEVDSAYDDATGEFRMTMRGHGRLLWASLPGGGARRFELPGSALELPVPPARPAGPYADLPFPVHYPAWNLGRITVLLPTGMEGFTVDGEDLELSFGGHVLQRQTTIADGVVVMSSTVRSLVEEITAEQTNEARTRTASMDQSLVAVVAPVGYVATEGDAAGLSTETDDVDTLVSRGEVLMSRRDYAAARVAYERAVELAPDDAYALASRGRMYIYTGDFARARADLDRAVELDPGETLAMVSQGLLALQERRYDDAVLEFTLALRIEGQSPTALGGRARANQFLGRRDRALTDYRAAIAMSPTNAPYKREMIRVMVEMGQDDDALQEIDALLAETPGDEGALAARAVIQIEADAFADALLTLDAALAAETDQTDKPEWLTLRAEARAGLGDIDGALADLQQAREIAVGDPFDTWRVCWTQSRLGLQVDRALVDCEAAITASPGTLAFIEGRGLALLQLDRPQEALADFDAALVNGATASSLYARGLALRALGRPAEAAADIAAALRLNPKAGQAFETYEQSHPRAAELERLGAGAGG